MRTALAWCTYSSPRGSPTITSELAACTASARAARGRVPAPARVRSARARRRCCRRRQRLARGLLEGALLVRVSRGRGALGARGRMPRSPRRRRTVSRLRLRPLLARSEARARALPPRCSGGRASRPAPLPLAQLLEPLGRAPVQPAPPDRVQLLVQHLADLVVRERERLVAARRRASCAAAASSSASSSGSSPRSPAAAQLVELEGLAEHRGRAQHVVAVSRSRGRAGGRWRP